MRHSWQLGIHFSVRLGRVDIACSRRWFSYHLIVRLWLDGMIRNVTLAYNFSSSTLYYIIISLIHVWKFNNHPTSTPLPRTSKTNPHTSMHRSTLLRMASLLLGVPQQLPIQITTLRSLTKRYRTVKRYRGIVFANLARKEVSKCDIQVDGDG